MTITTTTLTVRAVLVFRLTLAAALLLLCMAAASASNVVIISNLVSFNGTNGQQPAGPLLQAKDGNFYGTTLYGGTNAVSSGTIFRLTPSGAFSNIISFNSANGANPNAGLIQGADGNFYGTTAYGGAYTNVDPSHNGFGTIFKLTTNGVLSTLASFDGKKGKTPNTLLETTPGIFFGSANSGGAYSNFAGYGYGTLFRADTNSLLTNVLSFNDTNGASPSSGLTMMTGTSLYGTTTSGGLYEYGTAFQMATNGSILSQFTFNFTNGAVPGTLISGRDGNLYGTTIYGGSNQYGTIFKLTTNMQFTTVVGFNGTNGDAPAALIQGSDGNFYGITSQGGAHGFGNVFELSTNGVVIPLYDFTGGSDGYSAVSLIQGKDGSFYGTTSYGGNAGRGNLFKLSILPAPNIQSVVKTAHAITFTWPTAPGWTYDVQCSTNFGKTNWINWTNLQTFTASNATGTLTDSIGPDRQRFYRIVLHK